MFEFSSLWNNEKLSILDQSYPWNTFLTNFEDKKISWFRIKSVANKSVSRKICMYVAEASKVKITCWLVIRMLYRLWAAASIKQHSVANSLIMGSGCSRGKSRKPTDDEYWERYAPKSTKHKEDENSNVQPILRGLERDLSRSLSKPSNEEISSNSNYEPQPQTKVKRVRHGIDWNDLEKNVQAMNLQLLREDLHENPERFLINQILLSVQFFKNFERFVFWPFKKPKLLLIFCYVIAGIRRHFPKKRRTWMISSMTPWEIVKGTVMLQIWSFKKSKKMLGCKPMTTLMF